MVRGHHFFWIVVLIALAVGCATPKPNYDKEYSKVWATMIKSKAWEDALSSKTNNHTIANPSEEDFYSSTSDAIILEDNSIKKLGGNTIFSKKYETLVAKAYYKIIIEAEDADKRLTQQYEQFKAENSNPVKLKDRQFKKDLETVTEQYHAHKKMLEGLKSWNIFSENRTGDLAFFKEENNATVRQMFQEGKTETQIIGFLVYKLADLYHFEE